MITTTTLNRYRALVSRYAQLRIAVLGDFCLDRYFEIDPDKSELSIETGLPVHNVMRVRCQAGGAGTILNNLVALGAGRVYPIGFIGNDGEGFELSRALAANKAVSLDYFHRTDARRTFTYTKPLLVKPGTPPRELNRLDIKNWTPTPDTVQTAIITDIEAVAPEIDAMIVLDQVDLPDTGVITAPVLATIARLVQTRPDLLVIADSRRGLRNYPPVTCKMNAAELAALTGVAADAELPSIQSVVLDLARSRDRNVFVTLAGRGIAGGSPAGQFAHVPALPLRGEIDIVGAGDAVTANLTVSLAAGASLREALEIANAAASIVIHQLGTTGTASPEEIGQLL